MSVAQEGKLWRVQRVHQHRRSLNRFIAQLQTLGRAIELPSADLVHALRVKRGPRPEMLRGYVTVDVEGFGRDMELGGMITVIENPDGHGVWIFDGAD